MLRRNGKKACESANDDKDDSAAHSTALSPKTRQGGVDVLNQYARLPHQRPKLPAFLDGFARTGAVLQRVLVPRGAPDPGAPPCMRQRFLPWTDGDLQDLPVCSPRKQAFDRGRHPEQPAIMPIACNEHQSNRQPARARQRK